MAISDAWDVVVVPFPFTERAGAKPRPALVVSRAPFNRRASHSIVTMITTTAHHPWPGDTRIQDLVSTGLRAPSIVRLKLFTLDNRLIQRRLGTLSDRDRSAVAGQLRRALADGIVAPSRANP